MYFSGHKGFHVELVFPGRQELHQIGNQAERLKESTRLNDIVAASDYLKLDPPHNHIRLKRSFNVWSSYRKRVARVQLDYLQSWKPDL